MYLLVSGEGATDFGFCDMGLERCSGASYLVGPMALILDQLLERCLGYSILDIGQVEFVARGELTRLSSERRPSRPAMLLPGPRRPRETAYFFVNARALGQLALQREAERECPVVASLFRDSDDKASAGRGRWPDQWQSMLNGFAAGGFRQGVPMLPQPISEAWFICALQVSPYTNCDDLESRSGNKKSPKPLKGELKELHGETPSRETLCEWVRDRTFDIDRIEMSSFRAFRDRLHEVLQAI